MNPMDPAEYFNAIEILKREGVRSSLNRQGDVLLKHEPCHPTGSYKFRGTRIFFSDPKNQNLKNLDVLSAGNLALAAAAECARFGIRCRAVVPQGVSQAKKEGLIKLGAEVHELPFEKIWELVESPQKQVEHGFLHPFHPKLLLGYATIAHEILDQERDCDGVVIPYGLGGLTYAIIEGFRLLNSKVPISICEIVGHAPFFRALDADKPVPGEKLKSFIEAMGTPVALPEVFKAIQNRVAQVTLLSETEVRSALIELTQSGLPVEGAAAAAFAAAKKHATPSKKNYIALLTGKNISQSVLQEIVSEQNY